MLRNRVLFFVSLKKKKKQQYFQQPDLPLLFLRHVNLKIRVINQCELSRFIIVKVHLCQATLCWFCTKICSIFINHLWFLCLICAEQARKKGDFGLCWGSTVQTKWRLGLKDPDALCVFSLSLFLKPLMKRRLYLRTDRWSFTHAYVLHCSYKYIFHQAY